MEFDDSISAALFGKTRRAILALFFTQPEKSYFLRQVVRSVAAGTGAVQRELKRLTQAGILTKTTSGRQVYFHANPGSPVFNEMRSLVVKTMGVGDALKAALLPIQDHIRLAFIYGSMARGDVLEDSDVDIMVVGDVTFGKVAQSLFPVQDKVGREINPTVYPHKEFSDKLRERHHFLTSVVEGDKIFLIGDDNDLEELAR